MLGFTEIQIQNGPSVRQSVERTHQPATLHVPPRQWRQSLTPFRSWGWTGAEIQISHAVFRKFTFSSQPYQRPKKKQRSRQLIERCSSQPIEHSSKMLRGFFSSSYHNFRRLLMPQTGQTDLLTETATIRLWEKNFKHSLVKWGKVTKGITPQQRSNCRSSC